MRRRVGSAILLVTLFGCASGVNALCVHDGKLYAKTTLDEEFGEARLVVKGNVVASHVISEVGADGDEGIEYRVRVARTFKGESPRVVSYYTRRDSGGFYLDFGTSYLLFLNLISGTDWSKNDPDAMVVNYNCGQSRSWAEVPLGDRRLLFFLAKKAR